MNSRNLLPCAEDHYDFSGSVLKKKKKCSERTKDCLFMINLFQTVKMKISQETNKGNDLAHGISLRDQF